MDRRRLASRSDTRDRWIALGIAGSMAVLLGGAFSLTVAAGDPARVVGAGDFASYHGPAQLFFGQSIRGGDFPWWNPHVYAGMPFATHPMSMAFYPPNFVRALVTPAGQATTVIASLAILALLHAGALAGGVYLVARRLGALRLAAGLAAIGVATGSAVVHSLVLNPSFVFAVAWMPWVWLALDALFRASSTRARGRWLALAAIALACQITTGLTVVAIFTTCLVALAIALGTLESSPVERTHPADLLRALAERAAWGAGFVALAAALSAVLTWPALDLYASSARGPEHFAALTGLDGYAHAQLDVAAVIASVVEPARSGLLAHAAAWSSALVRLTFVLGPWWIAAILAPTWPARRPLALGLLMLLFVSVDLVIGPPMPLATGLAALPVARVGSSGYGAIVVALPLVLLAAITTSELLRERGSGETARPGAGFARLVFALAMTLLLWSPETASPRVLAWSRLPDDAFWLGIVAAVLSAWPLPGRRVAGLALAALLLGSSLALLSGQIGYMLDRRFTTPGPEVVAAARAPARVDSEATRVVQSPHANTFVFAGRSGMAGYDPLVPGWAIPMLADPGERHIYTRSVKVNRALHARALLSRRFWLVPAWTSARSARAVAAMVRVSDGIDGLPRIEPDAIPRGFIARPAPARVVFSGNTRDALVRGVDLPERFAVLTVEGRAAPLGRLHEEGGAAASRASLDVRIEGATVWDDVHATSLPVAAGADGRFRVEIPLPFSGRADLRATLVGVSGAVEALSIVEDEADASSLFEVEAFGPDLARVRVEAGAAPHALVFTDSAHAGWRARIDGEPAPIHRAHGHFKAVVVPPGRRVVEFRFGPVKQAAWGLTVSAAAAVACLALIVNGSPPRERTSADGRGDESERSAS